MLKKQLPPQDQIEYTTIAGAGVSGLYLAGKLAAEPHIGEISVREKEERIGGRLYTVEAPQTGGLTAELGGMRFMGAHERVNKLVEELNLTTINADEMNRQLFHYARGQRIYIQDYKEPNKIPYKLTLPEQGKTPGELYAYAYERIVPGYIKAETLDELIPLLDSVLIEEKSLQDWDLGDLARKYLSTEAYALLHDAYGFVDLFEGHNAYDKLVHDFLDSRPSKSFFRLKGGMKSLVNTLDEKARKKGVSIYTGQQLNAVMIFDPNAEPPVFVLSFAGQNDVYAHHLVLTMSPMALLTIKSPLVLFNDPQVKPLLESAKRTVTAFKVVLVYKDAWWHKNGLEGGRLHTSTPSGQIYDFGSTEHGAMLCIYHDCAPSWEVKHPDDFYHNQEQMPADIRVPKEVVKGIMAELREIFNDPSLQPPHSAIWKVWEKEHGAFFQWKPSCRSNDVMKVLKTPFKNVYITGDNVNTGTGWIEGALEAAEQTFQKMKK